MSILNLDNDVYELLEDLGQSKSPDENIKIAIATALFTSKSISLERAAYIAGVAEADFIEILKNNHIPWGEFDEMAMQLDHSFIKDMR